MSDAFSDPTAPGDAVAGPLPVVDPAHGSMRRVDVAVPSADTPDADSMAAPRAEAVAAPVCAGGSVGVRADGSPGSPVGAQAPVVHRTTRSPNRDRGAPLRRPVRDDVDPHRPSWPVRPPLAGLTVVVPARNEELALPHSLTALERALVEASHRAPSLTLRACIVLDSCTDASESVVRAFARAAQHRGLFDVEPLAVEAGAVGRARAAGVEQALGRAVGDGIGPAALWIACTDADTLVPAHWLTAQIAAAATGFDAYVGTVEPDAGLTGARREAWLRRHELAEGHAHVHGANLGLRASAYQRVGGFAPVEAHEDVDLVARLRADETLSVRAADDARVVTSSRLRGRAVGGFATYLANLPGGSA